MTTRTNKFTYVQTHAPYVDFDKELLMLPDAGYTSIDMRLSFNAEDHTCYYTICTRNNDGTIVDWEHDHKIPWIVGLTLLDADGVYVPPLLLTPFTGAP